MELKNIDTMSTEVDQQRQTQLGWKTTPYILGNEVSERIASYGLTWSMILYFIEKYHMKKEAASYRLTIISGITALAPILGGFVADAYLGRYRTILLASISNLLGMLCLLLTSLIPTLTPPPCDDGGPCVGATTCQLYFLYVAFVFLAIGSGGLRPCVYAFGADQFKQDTIEEKKQLQSFFNWYYVCLSFALLLASTVLSYVQLEVSWKWGFGLPTMLMALSILIFISGSFSYTCVSPKGSPFTELAQVLVASYKKRKVPLPIDSRKLYHGDYDNTMLYDNLNKTSTSNNFLYHTNGYRFLDKAAVRTQEEEEEEVKGVQAAPKNKWRLCEVDKVEAVKCVLRVGPIWAAGILPGSYLIQQGIWLPLQAQSMERHVGGLVVPATSMPLFSFLALVMWLPFYDRVVVPRSRWDRTRGISLLQRTGIGYGLVILSALVGGLVEAQRRRTSHTHRQLSVFWLAPQLIIMGLADSFYIVGLIEFLYDQMPARMRSTAVALFATAVAFGSFTGSGLLALLQHASHWAHRQPWIQEDLDHGHLDYYYYFLALTLAFNFAYFILVAHKYEYQYSLPRRHINPDGDLAAIGHVSAYFSASAGGEIDQASFNPAQFGSPNIII